MLVEGTAPKCWDQGLGPPSPGMRHRLAATAETKKASGMERQVPRFVSQTTLGEVVVFLSLWKCSEITACPVPHVPALASVLRSCLPHRPFTMAQRSFQDTAQCVLMCSLEDRLKVQKMRAREM